MERKKKKVYDASICSVRNAAGLSCRRCDLLGVCPATTPRYSLLDILERFGISEYVKDLPELNDMLIKEETQ